MSPEGSGADESAGARGAWSAYWREGSTENALPDDNPGTQALSAFWRHYAEDLASRKPRARILDLACGGGFALRHLAALTRGAPLAWELLGLDLAATALQQPSVAPEASLLVGDAARPPFADGSMDVVISQFGLEYAGSDALVHCAGLLAPGGELTLLAHHAVGPIAASCAANHQLIEDVLACGVLEAMRDWFAQRSRGRPGSRQGAASADALHEPVRRLESALQTAPDCPARQLCARLHADLGRLYARADAYAPEEVLHWLEGMRGELASYRARMQGMLEAARSQADVRELLGSWASLGLQHCQSTALEVQGRPIAWQLTAIRPAA